MPITSFLAAADATGLTALLNESNAKLTVFAPDDAALTAAAEALGTTVAGAFPSPTVVQRLVAFHELSIPTVGA